MKKAHWALILGIFAGPSALVAETMEEAEKKLMEAHSKLQSYVARLKHVEHVPLTGDDFMASDVTGSIEWKRKDGAILYRMEITGTSIQKLGGPEQRTEQFSILVADGKYFYTYGEQMGQKRFIKQNIDTSINGDIRTVLDMIRSENNFKLVADEKVDGADCYVIEITPKTPPSDDNPVHLTRTYFRKDIGLNVRVVSRNKAGKDVYDHSLLDLKANVPIDGARFILKPPADVPVTDMTGVEDAPKKPSDAAAPKE